MVNVLNVMWLGCSESVCSVEVLVPVRKIYGSWGKRRCFTESV